MESLPGIGTVIRGLLLKVISDRAGVNEMENITAINDIG